MRRIVILVAVIVVLTGAGGCVAYRWVQRGPSAASTSSAINRLRTSSTVQPERGVLQPPPGVYVYDGTGTERLSFLNTKQSQGPQMPGTVVTKPNGCWTFTLDYNSFHRQSWDRCASGDRLYESGGTTTQRFDFGLFSQSEHSVVTCAPPFLVADRQASAGSSWTMHCTGDSRTTKSHLVQTGKITYVGTDEFDVGGRTVRAMHQREELTISDDQTGNTVVDIWFAESNGLPIQEHHTTTVVSGAPAPINHVTYREDGSSLLTSLTPHR